MTRVPLRLVPLGTIAAHVAATGRAITRGIDAILGACDWRWGR